jgi:hypothetical protein
MSITLSISSNELEAEDIHGFALDLCKTLSRETEVEAKLAEGPSQPGTRGEPITIGTIILNFITGGAVSSMFGVLKSYFERSPSLEMEFQRPDGKKLVIRAKNVGCDQIERTWNQAREFFGDAG